MVRSPVMVVSASVITTASPASALKSGVWRWPVKTLSDERARRVDFDPVARRIFRLRKLSPPTTLSIDTALKTHFRRPPTAHAPD